MAQSNEGAGTRRQNRQGSEPQDSGAVAVAASRQSYPEDRFDHLPKTGRVGAHRVTAKPRYVWQYVIAGALAVALCVTIGIVTIHGFFGSDSKSASGSSETAAPTVKAALDPEATIAIFNANPDTALATNLSNTISAEGWGQVTFTENVNDIPISAVFYRDPADEAAALGLAEKLGGVSIYLTEDYAEYGSRLIVVLGPDYAGPGLGGPALEEPPVEEAPVEEAPVEQAPVEGYQPEVPPVGEPQSDPSLQQPGDQPTEPVQ